MRLVVPFVIVFGLYLFFARYGVDAHHDGVMVAAARIVGEGGVVHRDAFAMYGPIVTWLQAIEFKVALGSLVGLRIGSAFALAVAASFFFSVWRKIFGVRIALAAVGVWVVAAPFVLGFFDLIPWNSDYLLAIQGAVTASLLRRRLFTLFGVKIPPAVIAGAGVGVMCLTRPTSGIATALLVATVFITQRRREELINLFVGAILLVCVVLGVLYLQGGISGWWQQFIVFPRQEFLGQRGPSGFKNLWDAAIGLGVPSLGLLLLAREVDHFANKIGTSSAYRLSIVAATFAAIAILWSDDLRNILSIERLFWAIVILSPFFFLIFAIDPNHSAIDSTTDGWMVWAIGIASLSQLFPLTDYRHLWWAILPLLGPAFAQLIPMTSSWRRSPFLLVVLFVPLLFTAQDGIQRRFEKQYTTIEGSSVLKHMYVDQEFDVAFRQRIETIDEFEDRVGPRTVLNICSDGLFATFGRDMKYPDYGTVVWKGLNSPQLSAKRLQFVERANPIIWYCPPAVRAGNSPESPTVESLLPKGYRLVSRTACLEGVGGYDDWPLLSYLAVPEAWGSVPIEEQLASTTSCELSP